LWRACPGVQEIKDHAEAFLRQLRARPAIHHRSRARHGDPARRPGSPQATGPITLRLVSTSGVSVALPTPLPPSLATWKAGLSSSLAALGASGAAFLPPLPKAAASRRAGTAIRRRHPATLLARRHSSDTQQQWWARDMGICRGRPSVRTVHRQSQWPQWRVEISSRDGGADPAIEFRSKKASIGREICRCAPPVILI
jgi:hypothetical protein